MLLAPAPQAQRSVAFATASIKVDRADLGEALLSIGCGEHEDTRPRGRGGRPSRQQSALLSDRILDVGTALFLSGGYGATSIEAVAKQAGISKRTFYHRFDGKEALFEAVVSRLIARWLTPFDSDLLDAPSLEEGLRRVAEYMLQVALTPEALALHRMIIAETRQFPRLATILHELGAATGIERIARYFAQRAEAGERACTDPRFAAEQFILMVVTGPQRRALGLGPPLSPGELHSWVESTVTLFLHGYRLEP